MPTTIAALLRRPGLSRRRPPDPARTTMRAFLRTIARLAEPRPSEEATR